MNSIVTRLRDKFAAFGAMPLADQAVIVEFWIVQLAVDVLVLCLPYRWWRGYLMRHMQEDSVSATDDSIERLLRLFKTASNNYPFGFNCLRFSLAVHYALKRRGIRSKLHIGVSDLSQGLRAHAWTETGASSTDVPSVFLGEREFRALKKPDSKQ